MFCHPQRVEDALLVQLGQRFAGGGLHDHPQQDEVGAAVVPAFAGRKVGLAVGDGILHQFFRCVGFGQPRLIVSFNQRPHQRIGVVIDAGSVARQLAQRDLLAVGDAGGQLGQPLAQRVVHGEDAGFLKLQGQNHGEGFRVAADLEPVIHREGTLILQAGDAGGFEVAAGRRVHQQHGAGRVAELTVGRDPLGKHGIPCRLIDASGRGFSVIRLALVASRRFSRRFRCRLYGRFRGRL